MEVMNIQSQMYKVLYDMANRQNNFVTLNVLIEKVFADPEMLNDSFRVYCNKTADIKSHNLDMKFLHSFYQDMLQNVTELSDGFLPILDQFFQAIQNKTQVSSYVKGPKEYSQLRVFLILLYWPPLFQTSIFESHLLAFLKLLRALSQQHKECLSHWVCDMNSLRFLEIVNFLQNTLSVEILKLLPDQFDNHDPMVISECLMLLCEGLAVFQRSNQIIQKTDSKIFQNKDVMRYFSHGDQFNLHIRKIKILNFIQYPFLLDLTYKNRLLQIENQFQHQMTIERGLMEMINGQLGSQQQLVIDQSIIKSLFLQVQVNRQSILEDSISQIMNTSLSLKNPLKIKFRGEPGDDAGGVKKEYFQMLIKSIFNEDTDMFVTKNNNTVYWFNGMSFQTLIMFEFVGLILGLSIYNNTLLDVRFPRVVYKKLIEPNNKIIDCLEQLKDIEPDTYKSLKYILETKEPLQSMELTFETDIISFGERIPFELKPCGSLIRVNQNNKHQYVTKFAAWIVNDHIEKQFSAFKKGFDRVVTGDMIKLFSPKQLEKIICGSAIIDFKELRKGARYGGGFKPQTPIIVQLWEVLEDLSQQQKKAFLQFTTGSDRSPVGGLSSIKIVIERHTSDSDNLPNSRTCSNLLLIPEYSSKEKLRQKLLLALQHKEGFGLI